MQQKTCVITGANSGIGKAAALQIALKGHHVVLACRNKQRGNKALQEIKDKSQNKSIDLIHVDMSLQESIDTCCIHIYELYDKIDVLIHNAADFDIRRKNIEFTKEHIEKIWATNHIGPVYLTERLIDLIKASSQGRIITVSSKGLILYPFLKIRMQDPECKETTYNVQKAYYQSKLAQVMFTYWLSEQLKNTMITINAIRVTNVKIDISRYPGLSKTARFLYSIKSRFSISPEDMAQTYTYLALSDEVKRITGTYFEFPHNIVHSSSYSNDKKNIDALMKLTFEYINSDFNEKLI